jgi:hypothetical protein
LDKAGLELAQMSEVAYRLTLFVRCRVVVLAGIVTMVIAGGALAPRAATAHLVSISVVQLEFKKDRVTGEVRLPFDKLVFLPFEAETEEEAVAWIRRYVSHHISARGPHGKAWDVRIGGGETQKGRSGFELVFDLSLFPPGGKVTGFDLTYDAIIEQIPTHTAIVLLRSDGGDNRELGVFKKDQRILHVPVNGSSVSHFDEFKSAIGLGVEHISEGSDHLLFLLMLLVPAPLMIRRGRWVRCDDPLRSVIRIVHVVTAFAIGHSITLALAGFGLIHVPSRPVEALIALSILVAAIHVLRPLIPRGEPVIAVTFGLVHGLAFASLLGELDLDRSSLVFALFGFNLGIELTQLLVVALIMPSVYLLSRTPIYAPFRIAGGLLGIVLAGSWLLQRTTLTPSDPFESVTDSLFVQHPFLLSAGLAAFATGAYLLSSARAPLLGPAQQLSE